MDYFNNKSTIVMDFKMKKKNIILFILVFIITYLYLSFCTGLTLRANEKFIKNLISVAWLKIIIATIIAILGVIYYKIYKKQDKKVKIIMILLVIVICIIVLCLNMLD